MENRLPSAGSALPYLLIWRSSGTTFSLTVSVPMGCTRSVVSPGLGVENVTAWVVLSGNAALQLRASPSAAVRSGKTGFLLTMAGVLSPQVRLIDALTLKKR